MSPTEFREQIAHVGIQLAGRPLNDEHGVESGGLRYGRIFKPAADLNGFSVDVVDMTDIAGPHHTHPAAHIARPSRTDAHSSFTSCPKAALSSPVNDFRQLAPASQPINPMTEMLSNHLGQPLASRHQPRLDTHPRRSA